MLKAYATSRRFYGNTSFTEPIALKPTHIDRDDPSLNELHVGQCVDMLTAFRDDRCQYVAEIILVREASAGESYWCWLTRRNAMQESHDPDTRGTIEHSMGWSCFPIAPCEEKMVAIHNGTPRILILDHGERLLIRYLCCYLRPTCGVCPSLECGCLLGRASRTSQLLETDEGEDTVWTRTESAEGTAALVMAVERLPKLDPSCAQLVRRNFLCTQSTIIPGLQHHPEARSPLDDPSLCEQVGRVLKSCIRLPTVVELSNCRGICTGYFVAAKPVNALPHRAPA